MSLPVKLYIRHGSKYFNVFTDIYRNTCGSPPTKQTQNQRTGLCGLEDKAFLCISCICNCCSAMQVDSVVDSELTSGIDDEAVKEPP